MTVLGIDHVGITVGSLSAALAFYRDLLGLSVTDEGEASGPELDAITGLTGVRIRYAELDLGAGRLLELIEFHPPRGIRLSQSPLDSGASHLALRVDDVDALCARLLEAGVTVPGRADDDHGRGRLAGSALRLRRGSRRADRRACPAPRLTSRCEQKKLPGPAAKTVLSAAFHPRGGRGGFFGE